MEEMRDIFTLMLSVWKDKATQVDMERLKSAHNEIAAADADNRRAKMRSVVLDMAKLKTGLRHFTMTYQNLAAKYGPIPAIEEYIKDVQKKINQESRIKNYRDS